MRASAQSVTFLSTPEGDRGSTQAGVDGRRIDTRSWHRAARTRPPGPAAQPVGGGRHVPSCAERRRGAAVRRRGGPPERLRAPDLPTPAFGVRALRDRSSTPATPSQIPARKRYGTASSRTRSRRSAPSKRRWRRSVSRPGRTSMRSCSKGGAAGTRTPMTTSASRTSRTRRGHPRTSGTASTTRRGFPGSRRLFGRGEGARSLE